MFGASTSVGRLACAITLAIVKLLPEPVMPEQRLELVAPLDAVDQRRDRFRLVARGRHLGDELEIRHPRIVPTGCDSLTVGFVLGG